MSRDDAFITGGNGPVPVLKLSFDHLPPYAWPGGAISGNVVLEIDRPARGRDLTLTLEGTEISQTTIHSGKSTERISQRAPFFQLTYDLRQAVQFLDPDHLAPGVYRTPFTFQLPQDSPPSLHTAPEPGSGWSSGRKDGMYVEYLLRATLDVPWWVDSVTESRVPVFSARRVLGTLPPIQSPPSPSHPSFRITAAGPTPIIPGQPWPFSYEIANPTGKSLRALRIGLARVVEYQVQGYARSDTGASYTTEVPLGGTAPTYSGMFSITVPNNDDATGPGQGQLYRTYWMATVVLVIEWGFDVELQTPLLPA